VTPRRETPHPAPTLQEERNVRSSTAIALALLCAAAPASAQFNTYYSGTERKNGTSVPATAQFSVEKGRVAVIMKGSRSSRMLFLEKQGVLRVVDDATKTYFDLDKQTAGSNPMDQMEKQLAQMPPEQRKMAEQMMQGAMGSAKPKPTTYVWTKEKQSIKGYDCTKVETMVGDEKRSEYWGTTSADFKMTPDERNTMLAMQGYLRNFMISVQGGEGDGSSRAFQWDTSVDGYPLITRCFDHGDTTLDLKLDTFDRKPLGKDLFEVPSGFKKQEFMGADGMGGKKAKRMHG
jgi:hypothetical protein